MTLERDSTLQDITIRERQPTCQAAAVFRVLLRDLRQNISTCYTKQCFFYHILPTTYRITEGKRNNMQVDGNPHNSTIIKSLL